MFRKLVLALAAPLLLVTACATKSDGDALEVRTGAAAVAALRSVPEATADAGTAAFEMVITVTGFPGADDPLELVATGAYDNDAQQLTMEMDLGAMFGGLAGGSGEAVPGGMDEPARFVADGEAVYVRLPMLDVFAGEGGWFSITPEDIGMSAGSLGLGAGSFDPSQMLEVLRGTSDDVEAGGREDVRGVPTTKYTATVSTADALSSIPADQREELERQLDQLDVADEAIPVEVWVDADGLPRRFSMDVAGLAGSAGFGDGASMGMVIELFDYGEPVDIDVPSPDDVTPFTGLFGGLGGDLS